MPAVGKAIFLAGGALALAAHSALAATNLSTWAFPGASGRILRQPDALGNRVLDYSGVGYKGGTVPIPNVPVKVTISPVAGDNGASIQAAINAVKALALDTNGFRGAVLLTAGEYPISNSISINASGVILRGVGDGTNGTILRATGTNQRSLVVVGGSGSASVTTTHTITNLYVPVGARSFNVDSTSSLAVGDRVFVRRNCDTNWIHEMGTDLLCCEPDVHIWTPSEYVMDSDRVITRIEGNRVTVDAPLTCAIEQRWGGGSIRKYTWSGRIQNCGVESIRGESDYVAADDENHGWVFVQFGTIENAWARDLTSRYFGYSCVALYNATKWATVADCRSLDPVSIITGGRRYAFVMDGCQHCLVQNCYTLKDRHQFVTQSLTIGPNVFVDGLSDTAYSDAGPHHRWGTGALWDAIVINGNNLDVQNRGNSGSGHGWAGGNEVVWNCDADGGFVVQNPPTARNWLIGSIGPIENGTMYVGPHDPGTYDAHGANVFPNSLYYAQLQDLLAAPKLETREYWLGDLDKFATSSPTGEVVTVDAAWRTAVQAAAGTAKVNGFDIVTNNQWVPFTFNFTLAASERIIGASLALAMRSYSGASTNEALYLDSLVSSNRFATLGWLPVATGTNSTVRLLDLGNQLNLLTNGQLNLAVQDDVGLDWAMLEIQVATNLVAFTNTFPPVADNYVRGGTYAAANYGTSTTLSVKQDGAGDMQRQAYLRWDLSGVTNPILQARVRLTPVSVGTNALQNGATLATTNAWNESALTWNNQPGGGKRFATWIPAVDVPVEFAVTPQAQAAVNSDRLLALELFSLSSVGAPGLVDYASREDALVTRRPQLILVLAGVATNTAPTVSAITDRTIATDTTTGPLSLTVLDTQSAPQNLSLTASSSNPTLVPVAGVVFGGSGSNRTVTVTPAPGQTGSSLVTVTVTDPGGLSANSAFTLTVTTTNFSLFATNDTYSVNEDTALVVPAPGVLLNDAYSGGGSLSAVLLASPTNGTLTLNPNGGFTYTPATNFLGSDSFTYRASDGVATSGVATVSLTVISASEVPASGAWAVDADGPWSSASNWTGGTIANGTNMTATFGVDVTAARYVNLDAARTLGNLNFTDANTNTPGGWIVTNNPLTLQVSSGTPQLSVSNTTATLAVALAGTQGLMKQGDGTLVLSGANTFSGTTTINAGALRAANSAALGSAANGTTINNGATARLELSGDVTLAEPITVACKTSALGNVPAVVNVSGTNTLAGPITHTTGGSYWTYEAAGGKLIVSGSVTNVSTTNVRMIWLRGAADGDWQSAIGNSAASLATSLRKDDSGSWTLSGMNTTTGAIVVSNGTLLVNGGLASGSSVDVSGGLLGGFGKVLCPVTIRSGATLAPGSGLGTLTLSNTLTLAAGSTTAVEVNAATLACDLVQGLSSVSYAGTLSVSNVAGALAAGQSFQLLRATSTSGNFSEIVPATPGPGLAWSFNPASGLLSVVAVPPPQFTSFATSAGGIFSLTGTGPSDQSYRLFAGTNLLLPFNTWSPVATGVFSGGVFTFNDTQSTNFPRRFYRIVAP